MKFINSYARLDARLYHKQLPTPLQHPQAGHFNPIVAQQLGWDTDEQLMANWVAILSGQIVPDGFEPLAMAYAGHQFGHWAGQLGDGRGLLMAQVEDLDGNLTDLHLKGMGLTPYSRMGDGRAVLRSTIREYLCGHAMSSLGIRSSNALGFVTSKTTVRRETLEQGAALMRVADTHIRLGHIEWIANFAPDLLSEFTQYMITTYYPKLAKSATPIQDFISQVVQRTAVMIADWQLIGFAHGVMNTDNLSITGTTIDYGPFGFLERFNPAWINNHSDHTGRYAYQNQPAIGHWNLQIWMRHFSALSQQEIFSGIRETIDQASLEACLAHYEPTFMRHYQQGICAKLGLPWSSSAQALRQPTNGDAPAVISDDEAKQINATLALAFEFLDILETNQLDYSNGFRALIAVAAGGMNMDDDGSNTPLDSLSEQAAPMAHSHEHQLLAAINDELVGKPLQRWQQWQSQYQAHLAAYPVASTAHVANSVASAGTQDAAKADSDSKADMTIDTNTVINSLKQANPVYVLRNAMAQQAIEQAEAGDFSEVERLFTLLASPYQVQDIAHPADSIPPVKDAPPLVISCSS